MTALLICLFLSVSVCTTTKHTPGKLTAVSTDYQNAGYKKCEFYIKAPQDSYIALNFTHIFGFLPRTSRHENSCMPKIEITEIVASTGKERTMDRICRVRNNYQAPQVFQSSLHLKITYEWIPDQYSRFVLVYDFHKSKYPFSCVVFFILVYYMLMPW